MIRNILFVDDDQILRSAVTRRLQDFSDSFGVLTATDGFDAVQKLKLFPVSLVVLDLVMPRMDGMSLINHLQQHYADLPIIVVSSLEKAEVSDVAGKSNAFGYLTKPFQADNLAAMVNDVLAGEAEGGIMNDVSPPVFMQLMEMDGRTCTIRILDNNSDQGGILYFNQGELFDARTGDVHGVDAAYRIFSWDRTTIFISNRCQITEDRINTNLGSVIMKAVGMKDENEDRPAEYEEGESVASLSGEDGAGGGNFGSADLGTSAPASDAGSDFESLRKKIEALDGVERVTGDWSRQELIERITRLGEISGIGKPVLVSVESGEGAENVLIPGQPVAVVTTTKDAVQEIRDIVEK